LELAFGLSIDDIVLCINGVQKKGDYEWRNFLPNQDWSWNLYITENENIYYIDDSRDLVKLDNNWNIIWKMESDLIYEYVEFSYLSYTASYLAVMNDNSLLQIYGYEKDESDFFILMYKIDSDGNVKWFKEHKIKSEGIVGCFETEMNEIVVLSSDDWFGGLGTLLIFTAEGDLVLNKPLNINIKDLHVGKKYFQKSNLGNYFILGDNEHMYKIDKDGNQIWERSITLGGVKSYVINTNEEIYAIDYNKSLIKINSDGVSEFKKDLSQIDVHSIYAIETLTIDSQNNPILCADINEHCDDNIAIIKIDQNGELKWLKQYGGTDFESSNNIFCMNNSIYLLGITSSYPEDGGCIVYKINND